MTLKMMTATLATSAFVMGSGLAIAQSPQTPPQPSPRPQTEQPRTTGQTGQQNTMNEIVLQGCLARDDASAPAGRAGASTAGGAATAAAGGTTFLLKNATKQDAQSGTSAQRGQSTTGSSAQSTSSQSSTTAQSARTGSSSSGMGDENTYRLMASGASVNLSEHVGHQIEVRGRMLEATMSTRGTATGETKQAAQAGQAGQTGQTGQTGQAGQRSGAYGAVGDQHKSVMVSSVRMISQTCSTSK